MIFYLLANCFSAFSNNLCKFFTITDDFLKGEKPLTIILHADIINLFLFCFVYLYYKKKNKVDFTLKETFCNKDELMQILLFSIPIFASSYKLMLMESIHLNNLEISAMVKPFLVCILAVFLLKEKFNTYYIWYGLIICFGFLVANYNKISSNHIYWLISYIIVAAIGDATRRYYCRSKKNHLQAWCVEFFIFFLYGFVMLLILPLINYIFPGKFPKLGKYVFSFKLLFSPYTWLISFITMSHHLCTIYGVKRAKSVTSLEFINFSKVIFTIIFSYLLLNQKPGTTEIHIFNEIYKFPNQIIGAIIIAITLLFFTRRVNSDKNITSEGDNKNKQNGKKSIDVEENNSIISEVDNKNKQNGNKNNKSEPNNNNISEEVNNITTEE